MTSGPLSGLAEPTPAFFATKAFAGARQARKLVGFVMRLPVRFLDWQWERVLLAEQRDLVVRMGPRERADIGLPPRDASWDATSGFWRG